MNSTHYIGKAGEYAVAAQLLIRGINVHFPAVDDGVDLIAGDNIRIQIKTSRKAVIPKGRSGTAAYHFNVASSYYVKGSLVCTKRKRDWSKVVDFFVFWGIDENRFWVAPSVLLQKAQSGIQLGVKPTYFILNQQEIIALVRTGLDQRTVAARLGVSEMSVSRAVRGIAPTSKPSAAHEINQRENAWHEIIAAVGLVNAVNDSETASEANISKEIKLTHA